VGNLLTYKSLFVLTLLLLVGCISDNGNTYKGLISKATLAPKPGISYTLINIEKGSNTKCTLDIRLPKRIPKDDIVKVANYISQNEGKGCSPLFVFYFLPGETPGINTAWAYSHFNPELELGINGLSLETEATLAAIQPTADNNVVGTWLDTWGLSHTVIIRKVSGEYQMTTQYSDGSGETIPLTEKVVNGKARLYEKSGIYYVIENNGKLGVYDNQGLIYECEPKY
jgi:hypothetical protein